MNWAVLGPLLGLLVIIFFIGIWSSRRMSDSSSFLSDYYLEIGSWAALFWQ